MMRLPLLITASLVVVVACGDSRPAVEARDDAGVNGDAGTTPTNDAGGSVDAGGVGDFGWQPRKPLPIAKQELAVVALDDRVFVLGGFDSDGRTIADVSIYDFATDSWAPGVPLPRPLHHVNACVVRGRIWILGALEGTGFDATGDVFVFDPAIGSWDAKASLPAGTARGASMVGAFDDGTVIVAGGYRNGAVADVSIYDTNADAWTSLTPLDSPRDHGNGVTINNTFFAIGGRAGTIDSHTARVDSFDPISRTWTSRAPMLTSRAGAAAAATKQRIIVFGGEGNPADPTGVFPNVESYDPTLDSWAALPAMTTPRHGTGAAFLPTHNAILIPGGGDRRGLRAVDTSEALLLP